LNFSIPKIHVNLRCFEKTGPVVQLNRTSDSGSESRGFESRRGHKTNDAAFSGIFCLRNGISHPGLIPWMKEKIIAALLRHRLFC
jgi:hypothetical protein